VENLEERRWRLAMSAKQVRVPGPGEIRENHGHWDLAMDTAIAFLGT